MVLNIIFNGQGPEPPDSMYASGGTTHLIELMRRLCKEKNVNLHIISSESVFNTFKKRGIKANYYHIPFFIKNTSSFNKLLLDSILRTFLVCFSSPPVNKDIIYSASDFMWDVLPAFIWKLRNKNLKWAVAFHLVAPNPLLNLKGEIRHKHLLRGLLFFLSQRMALLLIKSAADLVFTGDYTARNFLIKIGVPADKIKVIKMGVDVKSISTIKVARKIYDACFVGRFHIQKGIFDLIEIWDRVCKVRKHSKLAIVGGGDEFLEKTVRDYIKSRATLRGNVHLLGFRFGEEYYKIIKSSKILLFPSKHEGNPIVPLDAMACGVPVIAYRLQILKEMYGKGIITVPMGNIELFAREVLNLLNDEAQLEKIGREIFEMASQFEWNLTIKEVVEHLKHLAGR